MKTYGLLSESGRFTFKCPICKRVLDVAFEDRKTERETSDLRGLLCCDCQEDLEIYARRTKIYEEGLPYPKIYEEYFKKLENINWIVVKRFFYDNKIKGDNVSKIIEIRCLNCNYVLNEEDVSTMKLIHCPVCGTTYSFVDFLIMKEIEKLKETIKKWSWL